jgi:hypothetical protein
MTEAALPSADPTIVKVGVLLPPPPDELGEWLADAAAFEAAGAGALWIDSGQTLDPLTLTAALAAITYRTLLVTALPDGVAEPLALATVKRLGRGRLALSTGPDGWAKLAADEPDLTVFRPMDVPMEEVPADGPADGPPGVPADGPPAAPAGGFLAMPAEASWVRVPPPAGRAAWRTALAEAAKRGDQGLLVPADPRLLDILRNPGDPGGRQDLHFAQG